MRWTDLESFTLSSLSQAIGSREVSPVDATEACLQRIERLNGSLNAFVTITADRALDDARRAEQEIARGERRGPLHGVPVAIKDIFATKGIRTTCGSPILHEWTPDADATVVSRLAEAGTVLLGKLNMSEFAYAGVHPEFGPPRNPWNLGRFTGGSSSGSGAAVAASLCFGSLGTDTGGSIRGPAAHCGIVGLKPTYGLVSRAGVVPLSWSFDHAGPMARTVEDAALLLEAIAGFDPADPTSAAPHRGPGRKGGRARQASLEALGRKLRRMRAGVVTDLLDARTAPDIAARVRDAVAVLGRFVASVEDVSLPRPDEIISVWASICFAEASAYHARTLAERPGDFSDFVRERLQAGFGIPAVQYVQAQRVRRVIMDEFRTLFRRLDLLVLPTMVAEAPPIDAAMPAGSSWDALKIRLEASAPFNVAGLPAVSVPCGFTDSGLPVGLQIVGPWFADRTVLAAAHAYEQAAGWWRRRPAVEAVPAVGSQ